jgi:mono/diheme cytochrome c family protein
VALFGLLTASVYLTVEAYVHDHYAELNAAEPAESIGGDPAAVALHSERYEASKEFLAGKEQTEREFERLVEVIDHHGGIPIAGARGLQHDDPETQGPRLFKRYCASCHDYADPEGNDPVHIAARHFQMPQLASDGGEPQVERDEEGNVLYDTTPSGAPNLYGVGSREWLRGFLNPELIDKIEYREPASPEEGDPASFRREIVSAPYFGNTAHRNGEMVAFVHDNLAELGEEDKAMLEKLIVALSAQADLKYQEDADAQAEEEGILDEGKSAFFDIGCADCHHFPDGYEPGAGPDLTGWMSADWLRGIISNPEHERFYGYAEGANDRMPAFAKSEDNAESNQLSPHDLDMLVQWLRRDARELGDE